RWAVPVAPSIVGLAADHDLVITAEDGIIHGGVGAMINEALNASEIDVPVRNLAFPEIFPEHQSRNQLLDAVGLSPRGIKTQIIEAAESLFLLD
ncbi:transketolase C-terminal domain-containing protein, partial [Corynebacterium belfantii]|nr:1-deoxy-D-xylulose-5-phosphate synthase [Corynebacterium belfantii]